MWRIAIVAAASISMMRNPLDLVPSFLLGVVAALAWVKWLLRRTKR